MATARNILVAAVICGSLAAAAAAQSGGGLAPAEDRSARQLMQSCDAHKFETVVRAVVDGEPRQSKVKLCGKEGQSDADWVRTLKDAVAKVSGNAEMPAAMREQIVSALNAEIARLEASPGKSSADGALAELPELKPRALAGGRPKAEYSALPPLPTAPPPPPRVLGRSVAGVAATAGSSRGAPAAAAPQLALALAAPKLSFACFNPGDLAGEAPCIGFERETMLTVRAREDLPPGAELRFARNGEGRASVGLAQLRRGKSVRIALPRDVCAGFGDGRLDLQLVEGGFVVQSDGPYTLRC